MTLFHFKKQNSKSIAKERLSNLLLAERIDCSPRMMQMIKSDITRTVNRYFPVSETEVICQVHHVPAALIFEIPIRRTEDNYVKTL